MCELNFLDLNILGCLIAFLPLELGCLSYSTPRAGSASLSESVSAAARLSQRMRAPLESRFCCVSKEETACNTCPWFVLKGQHLNPAKSRRNIFKTRGGTWAVGKFCIVFPKIESFFPYLHLICSHIHKPFLRNRKSTFSCDTGFFFFVFFSVSVLCCFVFVFVCFLGSWGQVKLVLVIS